MELEEVTTSEPKTCASVGRVVHFQSYNEKGKCAYAAFITQVNDDNTVDLATFGSNSLYFQHKINYSESPLENHWNWPPKI